MMLMAASWPSNRLVAVTTRIGTDGTWIDSLMGDEPPAHADASMSSRGSSDAERGDHLGQVRGGADPRFGRAHHGHGVDRPVGGEAR